VRRGGGSLHALLRYSDMNTLLDIIYYSPIHSLTHSLAHFHLFPFYFTHSLIHSLTHSLTHFHLFPFYFTHSLIHSLTHSLIHSLTRLPLLLLPIYVPCTSKGVPHGPARASVTLTPTTCSATVARAVKHLFTHSLHHSLLTFTVLLNEISMVT
jgi:hypothetical protein